MGSTKLTVNAVNQEVHSCVVMGHLLMGPYQDLGMSQRLAMPEAWRRRSSAHSGFLETFEFPLSPSRRKKICLSTKADSHSLPIFPLSLLSSSELLKTVECQLACFECQLLLFFDPISTFLKASYPNSPAILVRVVVKPILHTKLQFCP